MNASEDAKAIPRIHCRQRPGPFSLAGCFAFCGLPGAGPESTGQMRNLPPAWHCRVIRHKPILPPQLLCDRLAENRTESRLNTATKMLTDLAI